MNFDLIAYTVEKQGLLEFLLDLFRIKHKLLINFGVEIEFYATNPIDIEKTTKQINQIINLPIFLKPERGKNQYEINTYPKALNYQFINRLIDDIAKLFAFLKQEKFILSPKPYENDYGNSFQLNFSFFCLNSNQYINREKLKKITNKICISIEKIFWVFINTKDDLARLKSIDDQNHFMAPTHICYGINNRNCLFRICGPDLNILEFRLGNNNLNLRLGIYSLLTIIFESFINSPQSLTNSLQNFINYPQNSINSSYLSQCSNFNYETFGHPKINQMPIISQQLDEIKQKFILKQDPWNYKF